VFSPGREKNASRVRGAVVPSVGAGVIVGSGVVAGLAGVEQAAFPPRRSRRAVRRRSGQRAGWAVAGPCPRR
jgi:ABC-type uncharacterized transport system permease subunit